MLKLTSNFNLQAIRKRMMGAVDTHIKSCVEAYKAAGIEFVDTARQNKEFGNITHNLVSSMGCILVVNHQEVFNYFPILGKGDEGAKKGLAYAREIALLLNDGSIMLICVAGEEYAAAVEAQGKDVITGTDLRFREILKRNLQAVKK